MCPAVTIPLVNYWKGLKTPAVSTFPLFTYVTKNAHTFSYLKNTRAYRRIPQHQKTFKPPVEKQPFLHILDSPNMIGAVHGVWLVAEDTIQMIFKNCNWSWRQMQETGPHCSFPVIWRNQNSQVIQQFSPQKVFTIKFPAINTPTFLFFLYSK